MKTGYTEKTGLFLGSGENYEKSDIVIIGAPLDFTVSFRAGSRGGPSEIRNVSEVLEEYSPALDRDLSGCNYYDGGDIVLPFGNVNKSMHNINEVIHDILNDNKMPLVLGGEHLVSLPVVKAVSEKYPGLVVIQFDAHADLRNDYLGETFSHATTIRRISEIVGGKNIFQLGIRSGTREEFEWGKDNTNLYPGMVLDPLKYIVSNIKGRPVYITVDIDVLDPAYAPGTGTPEPGGCSSLELLQAVEKLRGQNIVGVDVVEVCPAYDHSQVTALTAAKLVREFILMTGDKYK